MNHLSQEDHWVAAAQKGDPDAFEALVHLYEKRVYALALRMCGNPQDAAEAAQEAFLSAWQGLPQFRREASFSSWLYRLTNNACIDLLRRETRHRSAAGPSFNDETQTFDLPDEQPLPYEQLEQKELREMINKGLSTLSPDHRAVLILREMHQLSYDEIAQTLQLDLGTVKSRISRGRKQLCAFLQRSGNFSAVSPSKGMKKEGCL